MADRRRSDDIKLGALYGADWPNSGGLPRRDPTRGSVFVSHEQSLRRDLEIVNARTMAELGPLPPGGLPAQIKLKPGVQCRSLPALNHETKEDETMKWNQVAGTAALVVAGTISGCHEAASERGHATNEAIKDESPRTPELRKNCGNVEMFMRCNPDTPECIRTSLYLTDAKGIAVEISPPHELAKYTAVGLDCAIGNDGNAYFVVQYGERPYGCKFCEWFHLYDSSGNLLTHSNPSFFVDNSLPGSQKHLPNNEEFNALADKLGIGAVNTELLARPANNHNGDVSK